MSFDYSNYETNEAYGLELRLLVLRAYDAFWTKNELGYDKNGKIIRTDIKRKRPDHSFENTNDLLFKKDKWVKNT